MSHGSCGRLRCGVPVLVLALGAWGCAPGAVRLADGGSDAGRPDAGERIDAGPDAGADAGAVPDAGSVDAGAIPDAGSVDAGEADAGPVDAGPTDGGSSANPVGPTITVFTDSGPVIAVSGQTISGLHVTNPNGPCITVHTASNVTIADNLIGPCGPDTQGVGIDVYASDHLLVLHNAFSDVASGMYVVDAAAGNITFDHNLAQKVRGPFPRGQMVQLNNVSGAGVRITCNVSDQAIGGYLRDDGGYLGPEDHINLYMSNGDPASPIEVAYNKLRGGGSHTGGGTVLGDSAGSNESSHDNIIISTGQYGGGIAGGSGMRLENNRIYGAQSPWATGAGVEIEAFGGVSCTGPVVQGNRVNYTDASGALNGYWSDGNCSGISGLSSNDFSDGSVTEAMWDEPIPQCQ